jgi:protein gp37
VSTATRSAIEWTDRSWNPVTGCTEVSPGCDNCYAKTFAERWRGVPGHAYEQGFDVKLHPERLHDVLSLKKPSRIFVNSMSDLFHRDVPSDFINRVFCAMVEARQHTFQVLTKRPERMSRWIRDHAWAPAENIWLGVSVESNDYAWRVEMLRKTAAAVRFISFEPLLSRVDRVPLEQIDWAIAGGESGPRWRPMQWEWARDVRDRCASAGTAFFMKQAAAYRPHDDMIPDDLRIRDYPVTQ